MRRSRIAFAATAALIGSFFITVAGAPVSAAPACSPAAQDEYQALRLAATCKTRVEVQSATTELTQVFANPDGTQTLESYATPQRVRKDGGWMQIDTKLKRGKDGRLHPETTGHEVSFSNGGDTPFAVSIVDGKRFELSWPLGALPAPKVEGDSATYAEVLPGADLVVRATRGGFTHVLVVKTAEAAANPAVAKVHYRVSGELSARNAADGSLELVDTTGKALPVGSHASEMWDSATDVALAGELLAGVTIDAKKAPKSTAVEPSELAHVRPVQVKAEGSDLYVLADKDLLKTGTLPIYIDPPWETWKSTWVYATNNNTNRTPGDVARVGDDPEGSVVFRSFFTFPVGALYGKQVLSAYMYITLDHNGACAGNTAYAYRTADQTAGAGSRVTWSPALSLLLGSAFGDSNETGSCGSDQGDDNLIFGNNVTTRNDVASNANASNAAYTIGLCMCSSSGGSGETGTYQWMKFFHASAKLVTTYNTHPGTPTNLTTSAAACGSSIATLSPLLKGQYIDADGSDTLTATFEWQELPSGAVNSITGPSKPANNYGEVTLTLPASAEGKSFQWRLLTRDANSPNTGTSSWCGFTVNTGPPPAPGVSSLVYPADGVAHGGPGVAADFTFTNGGTAGTDITSYVWGWSSPPSNVVTVSPGASHTLKLTPPRFGNNTLYVMSREPSLIAGPIKSYQFLVGAPSAPIAHWPLDQINAPNYDPITGPALTVESGRGDLTWSPDVRYIGSNSLGLDIVGETPTNIPAAMNAPLSTLDTSQAFTVAAWVRPSVVPTVNSSFAGKDGTDSGGFYLGLMHSGAPYGPRWAFGLKDTSSTASPTRFAYAPNLFTAADTRKWVHVAGSYDPAEKKLRLFLDGQLVHEADSGTTPWNATGNFTIGRSYHAGAADMFKGHIADVRVWNRVIVKDDLQGTDADVAAGTQAVPGILQPTEVGTWNFADYDALDGSYWSRHMTPGANASFTDPGYDGDTALSLTGVADSIASTSGPVLRTDNSHTISAWIRPTVIPAAATTVLRQAGTVSSATKLMLQPDGKWAFSIANDNGDGTSTWKTATSNIAATTGAWVHVTGVFDYGTKEVRLYVNGVLQTTKATGAIGQYAAHPLVLGSDGGTTYFAGDVDVLKMFAGAMNDREAKNLYNSVL
ncbi:LamG domain-containing protein [Catelliglobosispora koreensis]|uniref:LamG domain-containing protein n=1 Tax=Catelliglobosispora koreensis TaxID=129052 RepID=UPI00039DF3DE|nr:LamG domain-containing protein [Catelliglobosispora koreensis]